MDILKNPLILLSVLFLFFVLFLDFLLTYKLYYVEFRYI